MRLETMALALLCASAPAYATSYSHIPSMEEVVEDSTVAVHAIVTSTTNCSDDRAWTFVDLDIQEVLRGSISGPSNSFRIRLPYGVYPDGTKGTFVDTPALRVGDEVVLFLNYDEFGAHPLVPIGWMGWSVYRVFRSVSGNTSVVSGFGQPLFRSSFGPHRGRGYKELRALYYTDPQLSPSTVASTISAISQAADWDGQSFADGEWRGHIRVDVTGDGSSVCDADLVGSLSSSGTFQATGRCNADWAGATDIVVSGTRSQGVYTGTVSVNAVALPEEVRTAPWSSDDVGLDRFTGSGSGNHTENGYSFSYDIDLRAVYTGTRPLVTFANFKTWISTVSENHPTTEGTGTSLPGGTPTCQISLPVVQGVQ